MADKNIPTAIVAAEAAPRTKPSNYLEPFASRMVDREKRPLGDVFGLTNFGVNLTRLANAARARAFPRVWRHGKAAAAGGHGNRRPVGEMEHAGVIFRTGGGGAIRFAIAPYDAAT
jgi:hypothetical protein